MGFDVDTDTGAADADADPVFVGVVESPRARSLRSLTVTGTGLVSRLEPRGRPRFPAVDEPALLASEDGLT